MDIEERPPNRPNFLLILILFGATIIAVFVVAYFVLDWDAGGLLPKRHSKHPSSQLVLHRPGAASRAALLQAQLTPRLIAQSEDRPA